MHFDGMFENINKRSWLFHSGFKVKIIIGNSYFVDKYLTKIGPLLYGPGNGQLKTLKEPYVKAYQYRRVLGWKGI